MRPPGSPKGKKPSAASIIKRQRAALRLAKSVLNAKDSDDAVTQVVKATYDVVQCDRVSFFVNHGDSLVCAASPAGGEIGWSINKDSGIVGYCSMHKEVLNIKDVQSHHLFDKRNDAKTGYHTSAVLCMPILDPDGQAIGVVEAINKVDRFGNVDKNSHFDNTDEEMLQLLLSFFSQQMYLLDLQKSRRLMEQQTSSTMQLVEAVCSMGGQPDKDSAEEAEDAEPEKAERRFADTATAIACASVRIFNCRQVHVFMLESNALVCRGSTNPDYLDLSTTVLEKDAEEPGKQWVKVAFEVLFGRDPIFRSVFDNSFANVPSSSHIISSRYHFVLSSFFNRFVRRFYLF